MTKLSTEKEQLLTQYETQPQPEEMKINPITETPEIPINPEAQQALTPGDEDEMDDEDNGLLKTFSDAQGRHIPLIMIVYSFATMSMQQA